MARLQIASQAISLSTGDAKMGEEKFKVEEE